MLCQQCGKNPAEVFFKKIVNNQVSQYLLCRECAHTKLPGSAAPQALLESLLAGLGGLSGQTPAASPRLQCRVCGTRFSQFKETGLLGCSSCYEAFAGPLSEILKHVHGSLEHKGKRPGRLAAKAAAPASAPEVERLRERLKAAIAREDFEEAARIRDRLKELQ